MHARATAADMLGTSHFTVSDALGMSEAVAVILQRPEATRYQDLLVVGEGVTRIVPVSEVFEGLSAVFRHASLHDPLTGLPNRRMLELGAPRLTRDTHRSRVGFLFIDLDDFKGVNDTYGHRAGDIVLAEFAARLSGCVRDGDTVVRLGGDEFAVLLVGVDETEAGAVADRVLKCMDEHFVVDGHHLDVTATLGLAMASDVIDEGTCLATHRTARHGLRHSAGLSHLTPRSSGRRPRGQLPPMNFSNIRRR